MSNATDDSSRGDLRRLGALEVLDVYAVGRVTDRVRITPEHPLLGELRYDAAGRYYLSPEEGERGWGMGAIRVLGFKAPQAFDLVGRLVQVTGVYEADRGLEVETIALAAQR